MAKITLEKIANDIGVSKVAVFKALHNKSGVSDTLRTKIKEHAENLGYSVKSKTNTIKNKKFIFFVKQEFFLTLSEQYYSNIFNVLSSECSESHSFLQIAFLENENTLVKIKQVIASFHPDGIFFAGEVDETIINYMDMIDIPSVYIDYFNPLHQCNYVYVDNYHLSYTLTKYLINKGHTKIGFVGNVKETSSIADRYFGYLKAMNEDDLSIDKDWHVNINIEKNCDVYQLDFKTMPTAFICHCDAAAQWVYTFLAMKGLIIPNDVSIISFDNTILCENLAPKLTSAGANKENFAKKAYSVMSSCINNSNKTYQIQIKTNLYERSSVKSL
jgi:LacI family transcriptional regulator